MRAVQVVSDFCQSVVYGRGGEPVMCAMVGWYWELQKVLRPWYGASDVFTVGGWLTQENKGYIKGCREGLEPKGSWSWIKDYHSSAAQYTTYSPHRKPESKLIYHFSGSFLAFWVFSLKIFCLLKFCYILLSVFSCQWFILLGFFIRDWKHCLKGIAYKLCIFKNLILSFL